MGGSSQNSPKDFPNQFVVRVFEIKPNSPPIPTQEFATANTLEEIRSLIPAECVCIARDATDDPVIVETWL